MHDVLIVYDVEGWAYHSRALALARHAPSDFRVRIARYEIPPAPVVSPTSFTNISPANAASHDDHQIEAILGETPPDVVFLLCAFVAKRFRRVIARRGWTTRVVASWNVGWPQRQSEFEAVFDHVDALVINNREYWERAGRRPGTFPISNGVELGEFRIRTPLADRDPRVLWCGSIRHQQLKGYDDYIVPLFEQLRSDGIACEALLVDSRGPHRRNREQMIDWYNRGTVLVCASESEGTPNPALEAAACGCTLVSTPVGNMPELIRTGSNGLLVEREAEALLLGVRQAVFDSVRLASNLQRDLRNWGWHIRAAEYFDLFRRLIPTPAAVPAMAPVAAAASSSTAIPDRPDLSAEVTVFVSTVGGAGFSDCLDHLRAQDCDFRLEVIRNVAPMSAAFQEMLNRCQTRYYIQVDEDMLLKPGTVRRLYQRIHQADPDVALVVEWLWDTHLGRSIQGVKAYRHAIVKKFPFRDVQSCEKDQLARLEREGYRYLRPESGAPPKDSPAIAGLHGCQYDPDSMFERYFTLERKWLSNPHKLVWFTPQPAQFLQRFCETPTEENLMALLGVVAGRLVGEGTGQVAGEKDFRLYDSLPGLAEARQFFQACTAGQHPHSPSSLPPSRSNTPSCLNTFSEVPS